MNTDNKYRNALADETSPYLLQHAHNPVDWYPWSKAAFDRARRENKPVLLSVGYSACHWCHVMAHESFEDPDTAALMNRLFVNIKVDREERPDIDRIYQNAHSLLTQRSGGWPLTVFLTPDDSVPFFAGTYFPDKPRHGLPSFNELMQRVHDFLQQNEADIRKQNRSLLTAMQTVNPRDPAAELDTEPLDSARQQLQQAFDEQHGGFSDTPKFPHPGNIERLLRHWAETGDEQALHMALFTLEKMARGGVFDQLDGGFCRYSVDAYWMIPHFEKMLYDNGALLALYAEAYAITGNALFKRICQQTADWVMHDMQAPQGGYYSSLDADSEGAEGRYYIWTPAEVKNLLREDDYPLFARRYGLDRAANFEGHWHLYVCRTFEQLADEFSLDRAEVQQSDHRARTQLLQHRRQRPAPGRDDKVLTAWNGLMIRGMAIAARHLDNPAWLLSAERALDFIHATLWKEGRLLATCRDNHAHLNAYLDDYVYLIDGILELLQLRWREQDLDFAVALAEVVLNHFQDPQGGFFFTSDDHEALIQRPKPEHDDAMPSGNGIAAKVLGRLGHLLGETRYLNAAEDTLKAGWAGIQQMPHAHASLLLALEESLLPCQSVIIRGSDARASEFQKIASQPYAPRRLTLTIAENIATLPGLLGERNHPGQSVAYCCSGQHCSAPIHDSVTLKQHLSETKDHV